MDTRTVRHKTDMTQVELAEAIGVSRQSVCDFENFKTNSKKVDLRIKNYFSNYDFEHLDTEESLEKRIIHAKLQAAMVVVKDAMDKLEVTI